LVLSGVAFGQGQSEEALQRVIDIQEKYTSALMARDGVEGTAVGYDENGRLVIKVYTATVGVPGIPEALEGVRVQAVVTGKFVARVDPTARFPRPVPIGVSTGHPDITAGTIGCRVKDAQGNVYALSNNHVYANSNDASIGDDVIQPGTADGGSLPDDYIGTLSDFEPIDFSGGQNTIDAAIAATTTDLLGVATPGTEGVDGYGTPSSTPYGSLTVQDIGLAVQKYGRTTGWTHGEVSEINVIVDVCYKTRGPFRCIKAAHFVNQIAITPGDFSGGGDSGSLIVVDGGEDDRKPVGLLFAGSSERTIANPIGLVLTRFGVTVDDWAGPSNDPPTVTITSPADGAEFDSGATIAFSGTASDTEDGDLTDSLVWTSSIDGEIGTGGGFSKTLSDGTHTITAAVTDSGGKTGTDSVSITVGTPGEPTTVSVASITYATQGGRYGDKHLSVTVALVDDLGGPVAGASVSIELYRDGGLDASGTGTTGTDGTVTFTRNNAPSGTYTTEVTDVTAAGLTWDGVTPRNEFDK
jgi:hypothetical protein